MKLTFDYMELKSVLDELSLITTDTSMEEQYKNFFIVAEKESEGQEVTNGVIVGTHNTNVINAISTKASKEISQSDFDGKNIFLVDSRSILNALNTFNGLNSTRITDVSLDLNSEGLDADMIVSEVPLDIEDETKAYLNQKTTIKIRTRPINKITQDKVIRVLEYKEEEEVIPTSPIIGYFSTLTPVAIKEKNVTMNNIMFSDDISYVLTATHGTTLLNTMTDHFKGVKLKAKNSEIMLNFVNDVRNVNIAREDVGKGQVTIYLRKGKDLNVAQEEDFNVRESILIVDCATLQNVFNMTSYTKLGADSLTVDRSYFLDVIKRLELSTKPSVVNIKSDKSSGVQKTRMKIVNDIVNLEIPVLESESLNDYELSFRIMPKILKELLLSHIQYADTFILHPELTPEGKIFLGVTDHNDFWKTKTSSLEKSTKTYFEKEVTV